MRDAATVIDAMRANGGRVTPQRAAIVQYLSGNEQHPTVESIHAAIVQIMPTVSLKTVYSTVHELEALGTVTVLDLGTGSVRVDPNVETVHHHLVCRTCSSVRDLPVDFPEVRLPSPWAAEFNVDDVQIVFRGTCEACRGRS